MNWIVCAVGLTCVAAEVAAARSESAGWLSGSCGDERRTSGKVWGFPQSPHCPPNLPLLSHSCHCASFDRGSQSLLPGRVPEFLPSPPVGPDSWQHINTLTPRNTYISAVTSRQCIYFIVCLILVTLLKNKYSQFDSEHVQQWCLKSKYDWGEKHNLKGKNL